MAKKMQNINSVQIYCSQQKQIWTGLDNLLARVEALAISSDGKVLFIGNIEEALHKFKNYQKITITGSLVAGGCDSHNHFWYAFLNKLPSLANCETPQQAYAVIDKSLEEDKEICIIKGAENHHQITREYLKTIDQPIAIFHRSYHRAYLNPAFLKMPGSSQIPSSDVIDGWKLRRSTIHLLCTKTLSPEYLQNSLADFEKDLFKQGIVAIHDMLCYDLGFLDYLNSLTIDYSLYAPRETLMLAKQANKLERFCGIKSFADGAIGTKTARFLQPYTATTNCGEFYSTTEELKKNFLFAVDHGLQAACHGIGSAAISRIIETLMMLTESQRSQICPRIEHFECPFPEDIKRLCGLGGRASLQPNFSQDDYDYRYLLGERVKRINPFRQMIQEQLPFGTGSDGMPYGYRECLLWCIKPHRESQTMSLEEAVHYSTIGAAGLANRQAGLKIGHNANFVLFTKPLEDLYKYPQERIASNWSELRFQLDQLLPIEATFIKGKEI